MRARLEHTGETNRVATGHDQGRLDGEGRGRLTGIQPGTYRLVLHLERSPFGTRAVASREVTIRSGANRATIALPPLYTVSFEGLGPGGFIQGGEGGGVRFHHILTPTREGRAVCDGLPAGDYTLYSGAKRKAFTVPGASTVTLD